jgi:thiamine pyrophosphate-dependent acetolactate synthase large subunit-like protein
MQGFPAMYMRVDGPRRFRLTVDFSSIGLGLGTALGTAVARRSELSVAFIGDGGLLMSLGDLETAARYKVPLLTVVMNDRAYGAERHYLDFEGASHELAKFPDTDFAAIGRALGIQSHCVRTLGEARAALSSVAGLCGPLLLDCKIRPDIRGRWLDDVAAARSSEQ